MCVRERPGQRRSDQRSIRSSDFTLHISPNLSPPRPPRLYFFSSFPHLLSFLSARIRRDIFFKSLSAMGHAASRGARTDGDGAAAAAAAGSSAQTADTVALQVAISRTNLHAANTKQQAQLMSSILAHGGRLGFCFQRGLSSAFLYVESICTGSFVFPSLRPEQLLSIHSDHSEG